MRTYRARFSGGGTLTLTFEADNGPDTWEGERLPPELAEPHWTMSPFGARAYMEYAAEMDEQTVEVEDDEGPVVRTEC